MKYLLFIITIINLYSFEVNTHQAITKCAIENNDNKCNKQGAINLHRFAKNIGIDNINYQYEQFEKYDETYFDYAKGEGDFQNWSIDFQIKGQALKIHQI